MDLLKEFLKSSRMKPNNYSIHLSKFPGEKYANFANISEIKWKTHEIRRNISRKIWQVEVLDQGSQDQH